MEVGQPILIPASSSFQGRMNQGLSLWAGMHHPIRPEDKEKGWQGNRL